jgi:O-antigen/teichoic acid export membrane protein
MTDHVRDSLRGSSLLLFGRVAGAGVLAVVQILIVRHFSATDFGRWAYVMSVVLVLQSLAALGLDRAVARFIAMYHERGDRPRFLGVTIMLLAAVAAVAVLMACGLAIAWSGSVRATEPAILQLLGILLLLVPLQALDALLAAVFSCFGRAGAIFLSRHVFSPLWKLAAIGGAMLAEADIVWFAIGYVGASVAGVLMYLPALVRLSREFALFTPLVRPTVPVREVFSFTLPLVVVDVSSAVMQGAGALLLGFLTDMHQVAMFAAALPLAHMNQTVMRSFSLLYTSSTSRLLARNDRPAINDLYWRTTIWMAVLTFPVFAVTCVAAAELTTVLYGGKYPGAAAILSLLALAEYFNVALGFNGLTLRVLDRAKYLITISVVAVLVTVGLELVLIPRYGALGAAWGAAGGLIVHNVLKQAGLRLATGISLFDARYRSIYAALAAATTALVIVNWALPDQPWLVLSLAAVASIALFVRCRHALRVSDVFPEVRRVPIIGALLA